MKVQQPAMIAAARLDLGLTQVELAERLGVTQQHVSMIERGRSCSADIAVAICRTLGLQLDQVFNPPRRTVRVRVKAKAAA